MADRDALEIEEIRATIAKLNAETSKLLDEGMKLRAETRFPPVIVAALVISVLGIVAQVVTAILGGS